ncbi:MAG: hypothetical protein KBT46_08930 [Ruminococcus sp.]|nr:hypothetical protein [Candidatus Copronaster equi]
MSTNIIAAEDLTEAVGEILEGYSEEVTKVVKRSVDKTATETKKVIKEKADFKNRTGEYVKHLAVMDVEETAFTKIKGIYVKAPEYRKTHLLENGHLTRSGTRTRAFPHMAKGEEYARKRLEELIESGLG